MATDTAASNGNGRRSRALNFENLVTEKVILTARGGERVFALRDDVPASVLLRVRLLPTLEERWQAQTAAILADMEEEATAAESAGDGQAAAATLSASQAIAAQRAQIVRGMAFTKTLREQMSVVRRDFEADWLSVCGDVFRWSYPDLTDAELFGAWDERTWSHAGGIFSFDEAQQILELFTSLRGLAFSPPPSATEPPQATPEPSAPTPAAKQDKAVLN